MSEYDNGFNWQGTRSHIDLPHRDPLSAFAHMDYQVDNFRTRMESL